jgi:hypothetical protein
MSRKSRNFIIAYVALVALPLVSLAAVLKSGRHLVAPPALDGVWTLQAKPGDLTLLPCATALPADSTETFSISQSGRTFAVSSAAGSKLSGLGSIDGTNLEASLTSSDRQKPCSQAWVLHANLQPNSQPKVLVGSLKADNNTIPFRAVMQESEASKGTR